MDKSQEDYDEDYGLQIDMADPYEDDDFTIYFKGGKGGRKGGELLDHL